MFLSELLNLGKGFQHHFKVVPAASEDLRREAYRIRHAVYCRELGFEPLRSDGLETDEYDRHSIHCLLRHVASGQYPGCIRIIRARPEEPAYALPFERTCAATLDRSIIDPSKLDRARIAEVSRLAVLPQFRRRKGEAGKPFSIADEDYAAPPQPRFPYIPVGLYLGMIALARRHGIETLFVLTELRLAGHLSQLGVKIDRIGAAVEHRGIRIPSMMNVEGIIQGLNRLVRPMYAVIASEVDAALETT